MQLGHLHCRPGPRKIGKKRYFWNHAGARGDRLRPSGGGALGHHLPVCLCHCLSLCAAEQGMGMGMGSGHFWHQLPVAGVSTSNPRPLRCCFLSLALMAASRALSSQFRWAQWPGGGQCWKMAREHLRWGEKGARSTLKSFPETLEGRWSSQGPPVPRGCPACDMAVPASVRGRSTMLL